MDSYIVKERIGLPVWDGEFVRDIKHFMPGDTITTADFEEAQQDEDEQEMLIKHNCLTPAAAAAAAKEEHDDA